MTKLPQLSSMDKMKFHTHFAEVSSQDGIQQRKQGELESGKSIFVKRQRWIDSAVLEMRKQAVQAPAKQGGSRRREFTPGPCPGGLVDNETQVKDLWWCMDRTRI